METIQPFQSKKICIEGQQYSHVPIMHTTLQHEYAYIKRTNRYGY